MLNKQKYGNLDLIGLAFKISPFWAGLLFLQFLISGFLPMFLVGTMSQFIDTAIAATDGQGEMNRLWLLLFALGGIVSYQWLLGDIRKFINSKLIIATRNTYELELVQKQARLEYRYLEDSKTYDLIKRLSEKSESQVLEAFTDTLSIASTIVSTLSIALILSLNVWWAALAIILFSIPFFRISYRAGQKKYKAQQDISKSVRLATYYLEVSTSREASEERALFGYMPKVAEKLYEQQLYNNQAIEKITWKNYIQMGIGGVCVTIISIFVTVILLYPVSNGTITVGLFIALINAIASLTTILSWELTQQMSRFAQHKEFLKDLSAFCQLEETEAAFSKRSKEIPNFETLQFKNVTFKYPNSDKTILKNVNLTIEAGKNYAFVGENGAGKTTIIKVLTGQFTDYEGEILLNGININRYTKAQQKAFFAVAYQDFARYALTVKENILLGEDSPLLEDAIKDLELEDLIGSLSKGMDTELGKIKEEGVDLSGGQWQRLALARLLVNPAPIKILDEPTSALDPISESRLYSQFEKLMKGKTSIFISHRLGSIKLADEIFVFKSGTVIEFGNHSKLMGNLGHYQKMYQSQLEWYQNKSEGEVA